MQTESGAPEDLKFKEKNFEFELRLRITDLTVRGGGYLDLHQLLTHASALVTAWDIIYLVGVEARHGHTKLLDDSHVQPELRFNGLNMNFTESLVSVLPWTWYWTEGNIRDKLRERFWKVRISREIAGACRWGQALWHEQEAHVGRLW